LSAAGPVAKVRARSRISAAAEAMIKRTAGQGMDAGRFDAFRLAAREESFAGRLDVARRARIADRLAAGAAMVAWKIAGGHDDLQRPIVSLTLKGSLPLVCQRCLQPVDVPLDQRSELLLAHDDAELARLDADEREVVLAAMPLDAMTLIEDELLLSLPFAPMHPEGRCAARPAAAANEAGAPSAFAELAAMKKGRGRTHKE
jgi:uncharacterized protein